MGGLYIWTPAGICHCHNIWWGRSKRGKKDEGMVRRICKRLIYSSDDLMIIAMAGIMNDFYRGVTLFKAAPWEGTSRNWQPAVAAVV